MDTSSNLTSYELLLQSPDPPTQSGPLKIYQKEGKILVKEMGNRFKLSRRTFTMTLTLTITIVRQICYIPEKNLLVVATKNCIPEYREEYMIYIYNIKRDFNLVAARRTESEIYTMVYSKELGRVLTGSRSVQIWNLKTFQIEAESEKIRNRLSRVLYNPSSDVIVTFEESITPTVIGVYNRNLVCLYQIPIKFPGHHLAEMMMISNDLLLCVINFANIPTVHLVNLERKTKKMYDDKILIPEDSCIAMTGETPNKIFTCLTCPYEKYHKVKKDSNQYSLTQFTINEETEELVISRMTEDAPFIRLLKSENGKFLIAEKFRGHLLLNIKGNKVERICFISGMGRGHFGGFKGQNFIVLKDELSIVIMGTGTGLRLCKVKVEKAKEKKIEELLGSQNGFWCV